MEGSWIRFGRRRGEPAGRHRAQNQIPFGVCCPGDVRTVHRTDKGAIAPVHKAVELGTMVSAGIGAQRMYLTQETTDHRRYLTASNCPARTRRSDRHRDRPPRGGHAITSQEPDVPLSGGAGWPADSRLVRRDIGSPPRPDQGGWSSRSRRSIPGRVSRESGLRCAVRYRN